MRLADVALPVRVGREAHGRVEGGIRAYRAEVLRIERQDALQALQQVDDDEPDQVEEQHRERIALPVGFRIRIDARHAIDHPLDRAEHRREERAAALVHRRHEGAQRLDEQHEDAEVERELQESLAGHWNFSGFSSATTR